jgi:hypothetical protein
MPLVPPPSSGQVIASSWGAAVANQIVTRFTNAAQRASQLTAPVLNQLTSRDDAPGLVEYWTGSAWVAASVRELLYAQFTAVVNVTATAQASAQAIVTAPATTFDGAPVMLEFHAPRVTPPSAAAGQLILNLWDGSTDLGYLGQVMTPAAGELRVPVTAGRRFSPSAGSHTYSVRAWLVGGTAGIVQGGPGDVAANFQPGYLRATRAL